MAGGGAGLHLQKAVKRAAGWAPESWGKLEYPVRLSVTVNTFQIPRAHKHACYFADRDVGFCHRTASLTSRTTVGCLSSPWDF